MYNALLDVYTRIVVFFVGALEHGNIKCIKYSSTKALTGLLLFILHLT
jgi:hypothetical protein